MPYRLTDQLTHKSPHSASLSFVISALFWPVISLEWLTACRDNKANMNLMVQLFTNCGIEDNLIVPRGLRYKTREIWQFQSRFYRLIRRPKAMNINFEEYGTRKAMDFCVFVMKMTKLNPIYPIGGYRSAELNHNEQASLVKGRPSKRAQIR